MIEILDTTVVSNFALVGATAIFSEVLQAPAIPQEVLTEAEAGVQLGLVPAAACLAIAVTRGGCIFTDDLAVRRDEALDIGQVIHRDLSCRRC